jgi:hypothetical protein
MNIRVQGPDGVILEFPAGTDPGVMKSAMQKRYGGPQAKPEPFDMPAPPPGAVIHGGDGKSYVAGQPGLTVDRGKVAGTPQETIMLEAQKRRAASGFDDTRRMMPLAQGLGFGAADEVVSGLAAVPNAMRSGNTAGEEFSVAQEMQRQALERTRTERPIESFMGELAGSAATGIGAMGAGATTARFLGPNAGLVARMLSGALDGAIFGGVTGFNSGDGGEDRAKKAAQGAAVGGGVGGTMPVVSALLGRITQPVRNAISARVNPDRFAERQISATMQEARRAPQDIEAAMIRAAQEGQGGVYTIADELGDAGARQLGVAYRGPGEAGNIIKNTLQSRQEGQARRLINQVEEGFQSPQTKAQLEAAQKAARRQEANALYGAARVQAGAVNPSQALAEADAILTPGASRLLNPGSGMAPGERVGAVARARAFLTDGKSIISDFDGALAAKQEMDAMIDGASPKIMEALIPIRNALDDALAQASPPYAQARDAYRTASKGIEAIKTGSDAASRGRVDDTIPAFQQMVPNEQAGFRTGYADNLISSIEGQAAGADKSRMFTSEALRREVPAFAEPSRAQALVNQLQREQRMAETGRQAMGGSQTAMRMADDAGVSIGPESMANIARGNFLQPLLQALNSRGLGGNTPQARAAMAEILLARAGNSPDVLKRLANRQISDAEREKLVQILLARSANAATATGMANTGQK